MENENYIRGDLTKTGETGTSDVLGWVKQNASGDGAATLPDSLTAVTQVSPNHPVYYGSSDTTLVFSGTADGKTYDLHLNVTGFSFDATVNSVFQPNGNLVSVTPQIKLGEGSRIDVAGAGGADPTSVALQTDTLLDASGLVDQEAFSTFWQDLCLNQADRDTHHEVVDLATKTIDEKLTN